MWARTIFLLALPLSCALVGAINAAAEPRTLLDPIFDIPDLIPDLTRLLSSKVVDEIVDYFNLHLDIQLAFPGLKEVLVSYQKGEADADDFHRGLLRSIQLHSAFAAAYADLDSDLQKKVTAWLSGESPENIVGKRGFSTPLSPGAKHHFKRMEEAGQSEASRRWLNAKRQTSPVIYEDAAHTKVMAVSYRSSYQNLTANNSWTLRSTLRPTSRTYQP